MITSELYSPLLTMLPLGALWSAISLQSKSTESLLIAPCGRQLQSPSSSSPGVKCDLWALSVDQERVHCELWRTRGQWHRMYKMWWMNWLFEWIHLKIQQNDFLGEKNWGWSFFFGYISMFSAILDIKIGHQGVFMWIVWHFSVTVRRVHTKWNHKSGDHKCSLSKSKFW